MINAVMVSFLPRLLDIFFVWFTCGAIFIAFEVELFIHEKRVAVIMSEMIFLKCECLST